jgi:ADP-ribose/FAD diphosphatase
MVVGCIVEQQGRILMCKRAIEPRHGYWTVPAGYLELGESAIQGAVRETREEANAEVSVVAPYAHFDVPRIGQAYILYRARMASEGYGAGPESLEVEWMLPAELPWDDMAFPVMRVALELYTQDMERGRYRSHQAVVASRGSWRDFVLEDHLEVHLRDDEGGG